MEHSTIEKLANVIEENEKEIKWDCFVTYQASGSKIPIYFIHGSRIECTHISLNK